MKLFAICPRGLEALLGQELTALGASNVRPESGGVSFSGDVRVTYAANLHSRLASRVLLQVAQQPYSNEHDVYAAATAVAWEQWFTPKQTLRVDVTASRSPLRSLEFATLRVKDGVIDRLRERCGDRPSIDRTRPDVRVFAFLDAETVTLYLDLSGEPLFKRGWRAEKGEAPLKENLAAGLLQLAGWTPEQQLIDPFCGSGTILIEAGLVATRRAPGLARTFAFERLQGFNAALWRELKDAAQSTIDDRAAVLLRGSDISTRVIAQAQHNAQLAGLQTLIADGRLLFSAGDARHAAPPAADGATGEATGGATSSGMLISNPPYGEQSNPKSASVPRLMRDVGDQLKRAFAGWQAWFLTSDRDLPRQLHLQETRKTVLFNGPLECRFFRFEMVAGSYRSRGAQGESGS